MIKWIKPKRERWKIALGVTLMLWAVLFIILHPILGSNDSAPYSKIESKQPDKNFIQKPDVPEKKVWAGEEYLKKTHENKRSVAEIAIVDSWFKKVGYDSSNLDIYRNYSDEQLLTLEASGDIQAMQVIAEKYMEKGDRDSARPYLEKAIVFGSLQSIASAALISSPPIYEGTQVPYEESKNQLKEELAYDELLRIRGDRHSADVSKRASIKLFEKIYDKNNSISSDDEKWIQFRANQLYEKYQAERYQLGLGDFDNKIPPEVEDFLEK